MSNLINYLSCPKCLEHVSKILQLENNDNDLIMKLSCANNCSINNIKFSEFKTILSNQTKVPLNMFVYGNYSKEQEQMENISTKINNIYLSIEIIEKEIIKLKEELKNEIAKFKQNFEDFQLLHELIYGAYLKNDKNYSEQENKLHFNHNLEFININDKDYYNINNNFYYKEIEKDITKINNSINTIKKEINFYLKDNQIISINEKINNKNLSPLIVFSTKNYPKIQKHNYIETYPTSIKIIESIVQLSDGNIALGSFDEMIIYNLELQKEIMNIPGDFSNIRELKYYKINQNNKNNKKIIILALQSKTMKIYDIYNKKILLNYSQYYEIDNAFELYNGDVLYICDFNIYNINLNKEFNISLKYFCFAMINFIDEQNIFGYSCLSKIKLVNLDKPKKIIKEIIIKDSKEIFDIKQIYDEKINDNYLIILSDNFLNLYDLITNQFKFMSVLSKTNIYLNLFISKNTYNDILNINLISGDSVQLFNIKNNQFIHIHTIDSLKVKGKILIYKKITTPFSINNEGKYLLIFNYNEEGFNIL